MSAGQIPCRLDGLFNSYTITRENVTVYVKNFQCGGNDLRLGFYAAEWNGGSGDTMFVLCGERDHH